MRYGNKIVRRLYKVTLASHIYKPSSQLLYTFLQKIDIDCFEIDRLNENYVKKCTFNFDEKIEIHCIFLIIFFILTQI